MAGIQIELRDVYDELNAAGYVRPQIPLGQTFTLREDTKVGITIGGLMYVPEASEDIRRFVLAGRATWAARRSLPTFDARSAGTAVGD